MRSSMLRWLILIKMSPTELHPGDWAFPSSRRQIASRWSIHAEANWNQGWIARGLLKCPRAVDLQPETRAGGWPQSRQPPPPSAPEQQTVRSHRHLSGRIWEVSWRGPTAERFSLARTGLWPSPATSMTASIRTMTDGCFPTKFSTRGGRQIIDFVLPGDIFALQACLFKRSHHSVVTV